MEWPHGACGNELRGSREIERVNKKTPANVTTHSRGRRGLGYPATLYRDNRDLNPKPGQKSLKIFRTIGRAMTSPEQYPLVGGDDETPHERLTLLEKRVRRIEFWVPIFLAVSVGVTALATLILKVSMLVGIEK